MYTVVVKGRKLIFPVSPLSKGGNLTYMYTVVVKGRKLKVE
jgi:hypothetical protein